jgi:predicted cobalt transporter CbtA
MVRTLLVRGMLVGFVAGLFAFGVGKLFGEPQVDRAIAFEEQHAGDEAHAMTASGGQDATMPAASDHEASAHEHEEEPVSRGVQSTIGLFTGVVVFGTALGGLFALVFAFAHGRVGRLGPQALAALLAAGGFLAAVLVPALKYPPNPPAVGASETIVYRTELYFLIVLISVAALVLAWSIGRQLAGRHGTWNAMLAGAAVFLVIIVVVQLLLPAINEVPAQFPADVLWYFRITSLGMQFVLWTTIGLGFGILTARNLMPRHDIGTLPRA